MANLSVHRPDVQTPSARTGPSADTRFGRAAKQAAPAKDSPPSEDPRLKRACEDFEAILMQFMFDSMKKTIPGNRIFGGGSQQGIYESIFFKEIATKLSREKGMGIGDALYRRLEGDVAGPGKR